MRSTYALSAFTNYKPKHHMNRDSEIAEGLVAELLQVLEKYDGTMLNVTMLGCIDVVKAMILQESVDNWEDDEDVE